MTTYYLVAPVTVVQGGQAFRLKAGALVDTAQISAATLAAAGAELWPTTSGPVTTAAARVSSMRRAQGVDDAAATAIMRSGVALQIQADEAASAAAGGYTATFRSTVAGSTTLVSTPNCAFYGSPGATFTLTVQFPANPADGNKVTAILDGLGTITVDGNGHNVESATTAETFAATATMSTDNAPKVPSGTSLTWAFDTTNNRWKVS